MWFEVIIAVLILLYIYKKNIRNLNGMDILKILIISLIPILVFNAVKTKKE